jgi:hypothetical protein
VSHARVAIIADLIVVVRTGRTIHSGVGGWAAGRSGGSGGSSRSPSRTAPVDGRGHGGCLRGRGWLPLVHGDRRGVRFRCLNAGVLAGVVVVDPVRGCPIMISSAMSAARSVRDSNLGRHPGRGQLGPFR